MVTFFFDDAIAKVWYDASTRCLVTKIQRALTSPDLELLAKTLRKTIKKLKRESPGLLCSVTDMYTCENWSAEMVRDLVEHVITAEYEAGIARKFVVRPIDNISRRALVYGLVSVPNMNTSVHDQHELAREIERYRQDSEIKFIDNEVKPLQRLFRKIASIGS